MFSSGESVVRHRSVVWRSSAAILVAIVPLVLFVAAIGKLLDTVGFAESLATFSLFESERTRQVLVVAVPIIECIPVAMLVAGMNWRASIVSLVLLLVFTGAVAVHWMMNERPSCACMGLWNRYWRIETDVKAVLMRNSVLIILSSACALLTWRQVRYSTESCGSRWPLCRKTGLFWNRRGAGFTLVETLVTIAVIAVLVGLAAAGLSGARNSARSTRSLSNLRTHAQAISIYATGSQDSWPVFTHVSQSSRYEPPESVPVALAYFDTSRAWHLFMAREYYASAANSSVFVPPGLLPGSELEETGWPLFTSYAMSCAMFADHSFWNEYTRTNASQLRGTRTGEVHYPSAKALVVESWARSSRAGRGTGEALFLGPNLVAFCDASATAVTRSTRQSGYAKGDGPEFVPSGAIHLADAPPLLHTYNGVRGRDVR